MKIRFLLPCLALAGCNPATVEQLTKHQDELQQIGRHLGNAARGAEAVPYAEEEAIGFELGSKLLGLENLQADAELQQYVNRVGRWIALQSRRPDIRWRFGVVDTDAVNAYALPGGTVLVTRGMLKRLRNEAELAAVLAHEIAHVEEKHHLKVFQQGSGWNALRQGVALGVKVAGDRVSAEDAERLSGVIDDGIEIYGERGLDRRQEFQADRKAAVLLARAGYNPYALAGVLQTLGAESPQSSALATLFRTHPNPQTRLEQLAAAMGERLEPYAAAVEDSPRFQKLIVKYR